MLHYVFHILQSFWLQWCIETTYLQIIKEHFYNYGVHVYKMLCVMQLNDINQLLYMYNTLPESR